MSNVLRQVTTTKFVPFGIRWTGFYYVQSLLHLQPYHHFGDSTEGKSPRKYCRWEWNVAAVWGQITTGGGHSQLQETMSVLDVPVITKSSFIWSEHDIGEWWREEGGELADRGEG